MRFCCSVLLFGLLAYVLVGCDDAPRSSNITVHVENQETGSSAGDTEIYVLGSGPFSTAFNTNAQGVAIIEDVPAGGPYWLLVLPPAGTAPSLVGPFFMDGNRTVVAETLTYAQLLSVYGIQQPADNTTATVAAFGYERLNGSAPPREVRLTVDAVTDTGTPAVVTGIPVPPPAHSITVVDTATGRTVTFPGQQLVYNTVLVVQATFESAQ